MDSNQLKQLLKQAGATLVGIADLHGLKVPASKGMSRGIAVGIAIDPLVVKAIRNGPTPDYHKAYHQLNQQLDELAELAVAILEKEGHQAYAQTRKNVSVDSETLSSELPHKTIATKAGLGWIGRCALLVTKSHGSAIRLISIMTDAPLDCDTPKLKSECGSCKACVQACPGLAVEGTLWRTGLERSELYDAFACRKTARQLCSKIGIEESLCGKCVEVCPYTQDYIKNQEF